MTERIIDKSIIFLLTIAMLMVNMPDVTGAVVAVLSVLLIAFLTEIFSKDIVHVIAGAILITLLILLKEPLILLCYPMLVYSYCSAKEYLFRKEGITSSNWVFLIIESAQVLTMMILSLRDFKMLFLLVAAIPMGLKCAYHLCHSQELTSKLDDARFDAIDAVRKRREEREKEDEKIYLATLEERNRIAREIHDNIGHMLTRTLVQMEAIKVINTDENTAPMLDSVSDTLNEAMTAVRKSVHELHNESIDISIGINDIVKTLPSTFTCKVNTMIESSIPTETKNAVLAILKEAITNIVKYSKGDKVKVEFIENMTFWRLLVEDNGKNKEFSYDPYSGNEGIGLTNIVSRCEALGGRANISSDHTGFRVRVTLPKKG